MNRSGLLITMVLAVLASAVAVIEVKHESRKRFVELQALEKMRDAMNVEWGQLQLEQGTWSTHSRVERLARKNLQMVMPEMQSVVIVKKAPEQH
ncbi:MAG: cell division protein FtsL [Gammaproteobacteria bacterium]|nr:cell division protein FtsL [Gammaproteobacteria bacterium]